METKHIIEVDESQRRLIIGALNEKRNAMVEQGGIQAAGRGHAGGD